MVSFLVRVLFHMLIVYGMWLMITPILDNYYLALNKRIDYRRTAKSKLVGKRREKTSRKHSFLLNRHLDNMLYLTKNNYQPDASVRRFYLSTCFVFISVLLIVLMTIRELPVQLSDGDSLLLEDTAVGILPIQSMWRFSLLLSFIAGLLPYLRLRYSYSQRRNKGSYDLLEVVKIYAKFGYLNVSAALTNTADSVSNDNVLKRPLLIMAEVFAGYANVEELNQGAMRFSSTINTTFGNIFVSNLIYAERESNRQLPSALLELTQMMEQQRGTILEVKSNNRDAIQLGLFGNLLVLVMSVGTFIYLLTPKIYLKLQFQTTTGLTFFAIIISSLFISFLISTILAKPKLDYH